MRSNKEVVNELRTAPASWIDAAIANNDPEQRGEHEQVWSELVELFDQMVDLLGEEPVSLPDFVEILEAGLEQFDLALPPGCRLTVAAGDRVRAGTCTIAEVRDGVAP